VTFLGVFSTFLGNFSIIFLSKIIYGQKVYIKTCKKCKAEKEDSEFTTGKAVCKPCRNKQSKQQYNEVKHPKEVPRLNIFDQLIMRTMISYSEKYGWTETPLAKNWSVSLQRQNYSSIKTTF